MRGVTLERIIRGLEDIRRDKVSGASKIFSETIRVLKELYKLQPKTEDLKTALSILKSSHPLMAPIRLLEEIVEYTLLRGYSKEILESLEKLENLKEECTEKNCETVEKLIPLKARIATLSNSSQVYKALECTRELIEEVLVLESTPGSEGWILARKIEGLKLKVSVYPDSTVARVVEKSDAILLGGDAVTLEGGVVNKVGSYTITLLANYLGRPVYYLVEPYKFAPWWKSGEEAFSKRVEDYGHMKDYALKRVFEYVPPSLKYKLLVCGEVLSANLENTVRVYKSLLRRIGIPYTNRTIY